MSPQTRVDSMPPRDRPPSRMDFVAHKIGTPEADAHLEKLRLENLRETWDKADASFQKSVKHYLKVRDQIRDLQADDFSQRKIAEAVGRSQSTVSKILNWDGEGQIGLG